MKDTFELVCEEQQVIYDVEQLSASLIEQINCQDVRKIEEAAESIAKKVLTIEHDVVEITGDLANIKVEAV